MSWHKLADIKESYPVLLAEYAVANGIDHEPAFKWWVKKTLRRKQQIIGKVKSKYWKNTHKFGIEIPKSVSEAYRIDRETGTNHWTKAIEKEIRNVRIAFVKIDGVDERQMGTGKVKPEYSFCSTQMIFDIKMGESFTRKARLVAEGHKTKPPTSMKYSSAVSRDSVRIALTIASLNSLEVFACDIGNAYLNAPCREKLWTVAGSEFGSEKGLVMEIARALYGLKSSGAAGRSTLAQSMEQLGYSPTKADPDVWIKRAVKHDGSPYYKMMLIYVDDVLDEEGMNRFQQLIGILRWPIELGRIDILTEVSCLSQHLAEPRDGHLIAVYKIFKYLDVCLKKDKGRIVFDGKFKFVDNVMFTDINREEWEDFYKDAEEELPIRGTRTFGQLEDKKFPYEDTCIYEYCPYNMI